MKVAGKYLRPLEASPERVTKNNVATPQGTLANSTSDLPWDGPGYSPLWSLTGLCQLNSLAPTWGWGAGRRWDGGGSSSSQKNADAEDNELSKAEATHLVPATLY